MRGRWLVFGVVLATGCGEAAVDVPAAVDAGDKPVDAGVTARDAGTEPPRDGGTTTTRDAGTSAPRDGGTTPPRDGGAPPASNSGSFSLLSYNVAGLPDAISGSNPRVNIPLISPLLNTYDLVLVQEDFAYHDELAQDANHPHQSIPLDPAGVNMGDGLNRFSTTAFADHARHTWDECNGFIDSGSDCLTDKGFSVARHTLAVGVTVDVYNLHMDAGRSQDDYDARVAQIAQLAAEIQTRSGADAIIVAGDTNLKADDEQALLDMLAGSNLLDACRVLTCGRETLHDRIMFRSSPVLELVPMNWRADPAFVDANGDDLSDHEAIGVDFGWRVP